MLLCPVRTDFRSEQKRTLGQNPGSAVRYLIGGASWIGGFSLFFPRDRVLATARHKNRAKSQVHLQRADFPTLSILFGRKVPSAAWPHLTWRNSFDLRADSHV